MEGGKEEESGLWMRTGWLLVEVYSMDEAAASSIHLCLQSSVHSPGICRKMKGTGCTVCNPFVFLFVFYRAEEDMVSTKPRVFSVSLYGCGFKAVNVSQCRPLLFNILWWQAFCLNVMSSDKMTQSVQ